MKKIKIAIVILIIAIIIIALALISYSNIKKEQTNYDDSEYTEQEYYDLLASQRAYEKLNNRSEFFTVNNCIQKYYDALYNIKNSNEKNHIGNGEETNIEKYYATIVYNLLGEEYKNEYNVNTDTIIQNSIQTSKNKIIINEIYGYEIEDNIKIYWIYGDNINYQTKNKESIKLSAILDYNKECFSILPWKYIEDKGLNNYKIGDKNLDINNYVVNENQDNTFAYNSISDEDLINNYISIYNFNILYNQEAIYNVLDEEYRNMKFGNLENFIKYVQENLITLSNVSIESYKKEEKDGYTQYVCVDTKGSYYIIRETSIMQYSLLLDTYTVTIPEFKEKYDIANEMQKGAYNIEKIVEAINSRDYEYVYEKLDDTFKNNNFPTLESFEKNIEFMFFDRNAVTYDDYEQNNDIGIYTVTFKDYYQEIEYENTKKIFMKLKNEYDFVFSFSV